MPKAETAFSRQSAIHDTTIGWRFVNPLMKKLHGVDSMPETAENVAESFGISRADQDAFALRSQERAAEAIARGRLAREIAPVAIPQRKGDPSIVERDEAPARHLARGAGEAAGTVQGGRHGHRRQCRRGQ
jgi:acetyl-CoA acyltransferase